MTNNESGEKNYITGRKRVCVFLSCAVSAGRHLSRRGGLDPHPAYGTVSLSPNAPARRAEWVPWLQLWRCPPVASAARTPVTKFPVRTLQGQCVSLIQQTFNYFHNPG
ncbi:Glycine Receptor Subunit Beta [Manis pentadactyla]|nr:Glycine Receptor Subunit Beta [Manis pentadactyla]